MEKTEYLKNHYWKHWINARTEDFKPSFYDKKIFKFIIEKIKNNRKNKEFKILEIGIGTGEVFGSFFQNLGYNIYGVDISRQLLEKCNRKFPQIKCRLGDAHDLPYKNENFDFLYALHCTWYFDDVYKVINEMLRCVRHDSGLVFDIQNINNKNIYNDYQKKKFYNSTILGKILKTIKNILKFILNMQTEWQFVIHSTPSDPEKIFRYLKQKKVSEIGIMLSDFAKIVKMKDNLGSLKFKEYPRVIFYVIK